MKTKKAVTAMLFVMLSICLIYGLTGCGGTPKAKAAEPTAEPTPMGQISGELDKGEETSTVVGNWSYIDESQPWTLGFTEDGDFYDSRGILMYVEEEVFSSYTNYGSWRIRADGRIWFTGTLELRGTIREYSWAYSYELDGDTMVIGKYTFKRVT